MKRMKNLIQSLLLLIMYVIVSTAGDLEEIYAQEGETITLVPKSSQTPSYVYWNFERHDGPQLAWLNSLGGKGFSEDEKWKSKLSFSGSSLVINNLQKELFGTFFCKITATGQPDSVTVLKVIQVDVIKPTSPLMSGDLLTLTCGLVPQSVSQNKPDIYWLSPQGKQEGTQARINIQATSEHNGQWHCVVKKIGNEKKFPVSVTVVGLAPVPSHQYTSTDSTLTIPCSLSSLVTWEQVKEKEITEVRWSFASKQSSGTFSDDEQQLFYLDLEKLAWKKVQDKGLYPVHNVKNGNLSLIKSNTKVGDRGRYTCSMKVKNGRTLKTIVDVVVLEITAQPKAELIYGQQVNLSCSIGEPLPKDMALNWTVPETSSYYISYPTQITIPEVGKGDNGKWSCILWRGNKLTVDEILLKIEPRLSVWMLVIICSAAVILLLLLVLAVIHYRRRKQKMRLLRHRLCHCKNPKPKGFYRT